MIEIQLKIDGPWIPLLRAKTSMDLTINEGERILRTTSLKGIRVRPIDSPVALMTVRRYGKKGYGFIWQSASMGAPAFVNFDPPE